MKLIVGLGNPGGKYKKTRHNFGFLAIDYIFSNLGDFQPWREEKNAEAMVSKGTLAGEQTILAKPQTFMNLSGKAVKSLADFYKIGASDIWVAHDDFDLPLGVIRLSQNASNGGHKGVKSITDALGTKDFLRFRLGIHPVGQTFICKIFNKITSIEKFVLKNFSKDEALKANEVIEKTARAMELAIKQGAQQAMNIFN